MDVPNLQFKNKFGLTSSREAQILVEPNNNQNESLNTYKAELNKDAVKKSIRNSGDHHYSPQGQFAC